MHLGTFNDHTSSNSAENEVDSRSVENCIQNTRYVMDTFNTPRAWMVKLIGFVLMGFLTPQHKKRCLAPARKLETY